MLLRSFFFFLIILFTSVTIFSQVIVVDNLHVTIEEIEESVEDEILLSVRKALEKYEKFAGLIAVDNKKVTLKAIEEFNALFKTNALIYSDITKKASVITCENYSALIYTYLDKQGVEFDMFSAVVDGIEYDEKSGTYSIDVLSRKYLFNGIDDQHKPFYCNQARVFNLRFTFEISESDLTVAKISKIQGNLIKECVNKSFIMAPYIRVGKGNVHIQSAIFSNPDFSNLQVDFVVGSSFSSGVKFQNSLNQKGNFFITYGAAYSKTNLKGRWNGSFSRDEVDAEGNMYNETMQLINSSEEIKIQAIEIPFGVKFRIGQWSSFHLFLEPFIEGAFRISRPGSRAHFKGEAISYGVYPNGEVVLFNLDESDNLKPSKIDEINTVKTANLRLFAGSVFSTQYIITSKIGIELSVDYKFGLNKTNLAYNTNNNSLELINLSELYFTDYKLSSWGIQLSMLLKL